MKQCSCPNWDSKEGEIKYCQWCGKLLEESTMPRCRRMTTEELAQADNIINLVQRQVNPTRIRTSARNYPQNGFVSLCNKALIMAGLRVDFKEYVEKGKA